MDLEKEPEGGGDMWFDELLQMTQPTSGGAVKANTNCCASMSKPHSPSNGGPIYRFGAAPHISR